MSFFKGLFFGKKDPLLDRAEGLVQAAQIHAVGVFTPLLQRFPSLGQADTEQWDFIVTVAGIFVAANWLNARLLADSRADKLMIIIANRLDSWKPDGVRGLEDCKRFFEREFDRLEKNGHDPKFVTADALGMWIVWNVFGRPAEMDEEFMLVRSIGTTTTLAFQDWWNE